jgi:peptidoglycan/xylan/chitin deacetylase (PgdA/CDA1 family)
VRRLKLIGASLLVLGVLVLPAAAAAGPTVVSLTFDDALPDQYQARPMLAQHGMHGTFYVNTGYVGTTEMTWNQLSDFAADGNEIGGHTVHHVALTTVDTTTATHEVCDDRQAIISHGFTVTSFAYPSGDYNPTVEGIVRNCGYSSGRRSWGLCTIGLFPPNCDNVVAEPVPPQDTFAMRTIQSLRAWNTLSDVQGVITRAESGGGGWVTLVFHHICDGCDPDGYSVTPTMFSSLLDWLQPRTANGTYTRTVRDVISDRTPPTSSIACNGASCSSGWYAPPVSVSLSATDAGTAVSAIRYTTNGSDPTASSPLYSGPFTVSGTTTVKYRAWDMWGNVEATKSQLIQVDTTPPASSITCNGTSCSPDPYSSGVSIALSATDPQSSVAAIRYTLDGSTPTTASPLYTAPFSVASTTTVKYRAWDNAGNIEPTNSQLIQIQTAPADTTPPSSSIACNGSACSSGWYGGAVSVSLSASDSGSGVAAIRYTTDGSDPSASSPLYTAPFSVSSTTTVKYRAWDNAGNVEPTNTRLIQIDTAAPSSSIACNGSACSGTPYSSAVTVSLSANDGSSGVAEVHYTIDGSDPTLFSPVYTGTFSLSASATVKYRAWDNAGNMEPTNSQLIQIQTAPADTTPPSSSITCNSSACTSGWYSPGVGIALSATDTQSGVAAIRYTLDGSAPTTSSPLYVVPFTLSATTTVKYRAWDNAGNVEATRSQLVQVDTFLPTVGITSPANGSTVSGNVKIVASPADAQTGVASVKFYVDGSLLGTVTGSPWQVPWNTKRSTAGQHTLTAVATDRAGNSQTSSAVTVTVR